MYRFIYLFIFIIAISLLVSCSPTTTEDSSNTTSVTVANIQVPDAPKVPSFEEMKKKPTSKILPLKRNFFIALIKERNTPSVGENKKETSTEKVKNTPELDKNGQGEQLEVGLPAEMKVTGVMKSSKTIYAILKTANGSYIVKPGDVVDNYKVKAISNGLVVLIDLKTKQETTIPY